MLLHDRTVRDFITKDTVNYFLNSLLPLVRHTNRLVGVVDSVVSSAQGLVREPSTDTLFCAEFPVLSGRVSWWDPFGRGPGLEIGLAVHKVDILERETSGLVEEEPNDRRCDNVDTDEDKTKVVGNAIIRKGRQEGDHDCLISGERGVCDLTHNCQASFLQSPMTPAWPSYEAGRSHQRRPRPADPKFPRTMQYTCRQRRS